MDIERLRQQTETSLNQAISMLNLDKSQRRGVLAAVTAAVEPLLRQMEGVEPEEEHHLSEEKARALFAEGIAAGDIVVTDPDPEDLRVLSEHQMQATVRKTDTLYTIQGGGLMRLYEMEELEQFPDLSIVRDEEARVVERLKIDTGIFRVSLRSHYGPSVIPQFSMTRYQVRIGAAWHDAQSDMEGTEFIASIDHDTAGVSSTGAE